MYNFKNDFGFKDIENKVKVELPSEELKEFEIWTKSYNYIFSIHYYKIKIAIVTIDNC